MLENCSSVSFIMFSDAKSSSCTEITGVYAEDIIKAPKHGSTAAEDIQIDDVSLFR